MTLTIVSLSHSRKKRCVCGTREIERGTHRHRQIVGGRAVAMKGEESAVVPDPRFVLVAASGLYYHARDACKESAQGFCICFLSLSLSLSLSLKFFYTS